MIQEKYQNELEEMCALVENGSSALKVAGDYANKFEKEGISVLGILGYLGEYAQRKKC